MKTIIVFLCLMSLPSMAESLDLPYSIELTECERELEERDEFWVEEIMFWIADIQVNLHLKSLFELREVAIREGSFELKQAIDEKIFATLVESLRSKHAQQHFTDTLIEFRDALRNEPSSLDAHKLIQIDQAFAEFESAEHSL